MMKDFWNERYSQEEFAYGESPNEYFQEQLSKIPVGKILFVAEGEGRNAVFAATLGWDVFAFDQSEEGEKKATLLADKREVQINYTVSDIAHVVYPENSFDALVLVYAHFPFEKRKEYHQALSSLLKKGGLLILEGFSKNHVINQQQNHKAGGPKDETMLYDLDELKADFNEFEFTEAYETTTELDEGDYHKGKASVIRILAIKK